MIVTDQRDGQAYTWQSAGQSKSRQQPTAADNQARYLPSYAKWETDWQKSQAVMNLNLRSRDVLNQVDISDLSRVRRSGGQRNNAQESLNKAREMYQRGVTMKRWRDSQI